MRDLEQLRNQAIDRATCEGLSVKDGDLWYRNPEGLNGEGAIFDRSEFGKSLRGRIQAIGIDELTHLSIKVDDHWSGVCVALGEVLDHFRMPTRRHTPITDTQKTMFLDHKNVRERFIVEFTNEYQERSGRRGEQVVWLEDKPHTFLPFRDDPGKLLTLYFVTGAPDRRHRSRMECTIRDITDIRILDRPVPDSEKRIADAAASGAFEKRLKKSVINPLNK